MNGFKGNMLTKKIYILIIDKFKFPFTLTLKKKTLYSFIIIYFFTLIFLFMSILFNYYFYTKMKNIENYTLKLKKSLITDFFEKNLLSKKESVSVSLDDYKKNKLKNNKNIVENELLEDETETILPKKPLIFVKDKKIIKTNKDLTYSFVLANEEIKKASIHGDVCALFQFKKINSNELVNYYFPDSQIIPKNSMPNSCHSNEKVKFNRLRPTELKIVGNFEKLKIEKIDVYFQPQESSQSTLLDSYKGTE